MSFVSLLPSISEPERSAYPLGMCKGKQGKLELCLSPGAGRFTRGGAAGLDEVAREGAVDATG